MDKLGNNGTSFGANECIHTLFELQVDQDPEAIALVFQNTQLTYRQVDQKANQLAHYLQTLGVGPEVLVAISVERSLEMIIGILGILKAGGAYVPIDPKTPKARWTFLLDDTQAPIVLTQAILQDRLPPTKGQKVVCLDEHWTVIQQYAVDRPSSPVQDHHLIYTIYTSGSTGQPKGVQIEHRSVRNLVEGQMQFVEHPVKRFLYAYSFAFDGAVLLIYWTLLQGATLVIAEEDLEKDLQRLGQEIATQQISHLLTFASLYRLLLEQVKPALLASLESVSVAGEACPAALVRTHHRLLPGVKLLNQYGPTEATVGSTIYITPPDFAANKVPIGRPIQGVQIYILNEDLQKVAVGEIGEIFIGGRGLARAYLNRPQLTQERFLPHPFSENPNDRLYRTGDLARWLPDGQIDFIGRSDDQIKLRGYRIELGEVEACIAQHPSIGEVAVLLKGEQVAQQKLVAYVVLRQAIALDIHELRTFLKQYLPDYMIPARVQILNQMPLTLAGKIDRKALPDP
ncbi:MAG: amino acid adenylation domain-containing protein, partial [Bacteroidota bacterium]